MLAPAPHGQLVVGSAKHGIQATGLQGDRGALRVAPCAPVELQRRPRLRPHAQMLRKTAGIAGSLERLPRQQAGRLVLAVSVRRSSAEHRHNDLGTEGANHPDDVAEQRVSRPVLERFLGRLRIAEVVGPGEVLGRPVHPAGSEQLSRPHDAEPLAHLGADQVLAPLSPVQRQVRRSRAPAPRQGGEQRGVLVVGMRADDEHALDSVQLTDEESCAQGTGGAGQHLLARQVAREQAEKGPEETQLQESALRRRCWHRPEATVDRRCPRYPVLRGRTRR